MDIFATPDLVGFSIENTLPYQSFSLTGMDKLGPLETKTLQQLRVDFCVFKATYQSNMTLRALFDNGTLVATPITDPGNGIVCALTEDSFTKSFIETSPTPPISVAPGKIWIRSTDSSQFSWNAGLNKWLSTDKQQKELGRNFGTAQDQYLFGPDGLPSNESPLIAEGNLCIMQATVSCKTASAFSIEIHKYVSGSWVSVGSFSNPGAVQAVSSFNIDVGSGDRLALYLNGVADHPRVDIYYRERA